MTFDRGYFDNLIKDSERYYAHISPEGKDFPPELLSEHSALTVSYARRLSHDNGLGPIIEKLVHDSLGESVSPELEGFVKGLFRSAIAFHDLGKLNEKFQRDKMKNGNNFPVISHPFDSDHSVISAYLYLAIIFKKYLEIESELNEDAKTRICNISLYFGYNIMQHHSALLSEGQCDRRWNDAKLYSLDPYIFQLNIPLTNDEIGYYHNFLSYATFDFGLFDSYNKYLSELRDKGFPLYALLRLNYSILTSADYLSTSHYMNQWKEMHTETGVITDQLRQAMITGIRTCKRYNTETFNAIDRRIDPWQQNLVERSYHNLNMLRRNLSLEVIANIRKNSSNRLFYLEAPTGSGKTNASMLAVSELLQIDHSIEKVFYVFPFTTLITQTYKSIKETFGIRESDMAQIHSKAPVSTGTYEKDYTNYIDEMLMNYPIVLLSHVRFFDILKTNKKANNYLLQRLANSVVVIDELQSYSPSIWSEILYLISSYAEYFNVRFVLMSATLPKIGDLMKDGNSGDAFVNLVSDKSRYFQNPNFCNRVIFEYSLMNDLSVDRYDRTVYLENLNAIVQEKSDEYARQNSNENHSALTLIEFITKRTASDFYAIAKKSNNVFDKILILSGTILEPRRREIIDFLKTSKCRQMKVLLVTTQVVEAGVDIDMDLGFKDKSIIDSEEQIAGRINRNASKHNCKLYIFDFDSEKLVYGKDQRYEVMKKFDDKEYERILAQKDFDSLYNIIMCKLRKLNSSSYIENINDMFDGIKTLDYKKVDKSLEIIDEQNVTVFVPIPIPITSLVGFEETIMEMNLSIDGMVDGQILWNKYVNIIHEPCDNFLAQKIKLKKLMKLMSQFCFNFFPKSKDFKDLQTYGEMRYGFFYLENYKEVYSYEDGINTSALQYSNFW